MIDRRDYFIEAMRERRKMTDPKYMRGGLDFARGKAIEELGELQAALGKSLRWGWHSVNPELPPAQQEMNKDWVLRELADVRGALDNLERELSLLPARAWSPGGDGSRS